MGTHMTAHHDLRLRTTLPYERVESMLSNSCAKVFSMILGNPPIFRGS